MPRCHRLRWHWFVPVVVMVVGAGDVDFVAVDALFAVAVDYSGVTIVSNNQKELVD